MEMLHCSSSARLPTPALRTSRPTRALSCRGILGHFGRHFHLTGGGVDGTGRPRKVHAYSREFKLTAVRLSQQPGIQVQAVAAAPPSAPAAGYSPQIDPRRRRPRWCVQPAVLREGRLKFLSLPAPCLRPDRASPSAHRVPTARCTMFVGTTPRLDLPSCYLSARRHPSRFSHPHW